MIFAFSVYIAQNQSKRPSVQTLTRSVCAWSDDLHIHLKSGLRALPVTEDKKLNVTIKFSQRKRINHVGVDLFTSLKTSLLII